MTPFQLFRLWARRAPAGERVAALVTAALVVAVLGWVVVPSSSGSSSQDSLSALSGSSAPATNAGAGAAPVAGKGGGPVSAGSIAPGPAGAAVPGAASGGATQGSQASGASVRVTGGGSGGQAASTCPAAHDTGVTGSEIKLAITTSNIVGPAGNQTFGIPTADEQKADYQAVIDAVNAAGGVACRKLAPTFYKDNPADQNDLQQKCLDVAAAGMFAVLDPSSYASFPQKDCYPQHHVPYFTSYFLPASEINQFYPYMFAFDSLDSLYHNAVFGLRDHGFFRPSNGFKKLGFVYRNCYPTLIKEMYAWFHASGVSDSQIVDYSVGCPTAFANPNDLEQAVLKFRQNGVTHVVNGPGFEGDLANFTNISEQQGFRPKYGLADEAIISVSYGSQHPNYSNLANALIVTASSFGEERTPGMHPDATTDKCNAIYKAHGMPPVYSDPSGFSGYICNEVWMFAAAVAHAPVLQRSSLAAGLQAARSVPMSWPQGPNDFSSGRVTVAGQYWRLDQFFSSCNCWRVIDRTFHPSYH